MDTIATADALKKARDKLMQVIIGDLFPIDSTELDPNNCVNGYPDIIDDTYICGNDKPIDEDLGILGFAGPSYWRINSGVQNFTSITGQMTFDIVDIPFMIANGLLEDVVLHEMLHVMGFGTAWEPAGLVSASNIYSGANGQAVWSEWGCVDTPPVENDGGEGTAGKHWDEDCLEDESEDGRKTN